MKLLKRGMAGSLGLLMVALTLSGCGTSTNSTKASASKQVDMIISTFNNPFFVSVKNGAENEAKKLGYTLVVQNANNDSPTELNLAQTDIEEKPAALILDPVDSNAIVTAINSANSANVPVFAFDRMPAGGKILTFIGYDDFSGGKAAADALAKGVNDTGEVVEIQGTMGTNVAQNRSKSFEAEIAKFPNIHIVAKQPADFDRSQAMNVMTNLLEAHPGIKGVYASNDEMAMGVLAALKAKGLNKKVILIGNDGIKDALNAITSGDIYATIAESPYYEGVQVADIAEKIISKKVIPAETTLEGRMVNKSNIADYWKYLNKIGDPTD